MTHSTVLTLFLISSQTIIRSRRRRYKDLWLECLLSVNTIQSDYGSSVLIVSTDT
uniref:Uncharacterized protein n=1 Tax=Arion vulgaris TaxID=1028688 RepID=A0A0B7ATG3_9EUPU